MLNEPSLIESLQWPEASGRHITIDVLRLDRLHPVVSGNKWFKLKGYLQEALQSAGPRTIVTFGGAWSNHLAATAYAAQKAGLEAIGIVRGERPPVPSATLEMAAACGMQLEFITRREYAGKNLPDTFNRLTSLYPDAYIIPEGGAGEIGIRGSEDILRCIDVEKYSHICCAVGTGTTLMGLARASNSNQEVIGIPVLKGIKTLATLFPSAAGPAATKPENILSPEQQTRTRLLTGYHFGGYARHPQELLGFMNHFYRMTGIPSDIVYTGKLFYAILHSIDQGFFPARSRLLLIHTGGLQGNLSLSPGILDF